MKCDLCKEIQGLLERSTSKVILKMDVLIDSYLIPASSVLALKFMKEGEIKWNYCFFICSNRKNINYVMVQTQ